MATGSPRKAARRSSRNASTDDKAPGDVRILADAASREMRLGSERDGAEPLSPPVKRKALFDEVIDEELPRSKRSRNKTSKAEAEYIDSDSDDEEENDDELLLVPTPKKKQKHGMRADPISDDDELPATISRPKKTSAKESKTKTKVKSQTKATPKAKPKGKEPDPIPDEINLLVPTISSSQIALKQISLDWSASFEEALRPLSMQSAATASRSKAILLDKKTWPSLRDGVVSKFKKSKPVNEAVEFCLLPENYMPSLLARQKKSSATSNTGPRRGRPSNAKKILDLEHASGDDDDDVGEEKDTMVLEQDKYTLLERKLKGQCAPCAAKDPDIWCKIDCDGNHANVTFQQRNGWAHSLAAAEHGVTLENPPNMEHNCFFCNFPPPCTTHPPASATQAFNIYLDVDSGSSAAIKSSGTLFPNF
ncbi:hypothetical protein GGX14DRAFT_581167 [Mycena pura]|uniref:Uncharacterized protein n=1 Tax=Mycena pura TaxID=153505 RepID=A0AAD6XX13_9AGAR|nr:hypothetical protein GGX14DRAFT_581167 [Mycena pura]